MKKDEVDAVGRATCGPAASVQTVRLVDRFGGLGDARRGEAPDEAAPTTRAQLYELPELPASMFGKLDSCSGSPRRAPSVRRLPQVKELLRGIPASVLVDPAQAQARLPFDLSWD
jgi:hypothetical protein